MKSELQLVAEHPATYSLAAQHNAHPLLRDLSLHYSIIIEDELLEDSTAVVDALPLEKPKPFKQLVVKLTSEPNIFSPEEWLIDEIRPGQVITLQKRPLNISHKFLFDLTEEVRTSICLEVYFSDEPENILASKQITIVMLPANFLGGRESAT